MRVAGGSQKTTSILVTAFVVFISRDEFSDIAPPCDALGEAAFIEDPAAER